MCAQRFVDNLAQAICEGISTPKSVGVYLLLKYGAYDELARLRVHPGDYTNSEAYFADSVVVNLLRKDESLPTTFDRKAAAKRNFWASERRCFKANHRLRPYLEGFSHPDTDGHVGCLLQLARKHVRRMIGDSPPVPTGRFGPGSTYADRGRFNTLPDKMQSSPTVTELATPFLPEWGLTAWGRTCASELRDEIVVPGNRFSTVPKDCEKDRGICVEPSINLFYQLGFGRVMKDRLQHVGIDLQHAQDKHRRMAWLASIKRHLGTIDLSNASDTICRVIVRLLLPSRWHLVLDALRSPTTLIDGKTVRLEKFSSMGNGYTFELETVIFTALCAAAMESIGIEPVYGSNVSVFGDDILVPTDACESVLAVLSFFGFEANKSKTFVNGPFRESCGGDFFDGADVRPYYVESEIEEPQHYIGLANAIRKLREKTSDVVLKKALTRAWFKCLDQLPASIRSLRGPEHFGDLLIHDDENAWNYRMRHSIREFRAYKPVFTGYVKWKHFTPDVVLASALYYAGKRPEPGSDLGRDGILPRDAGRSFSIGWVPYS